MKGRITIGLVLDLYRKKGYPLSDDQLPYLLNIFGIRSTSQIPNSFDDVIGVLYREVNLEWRLEVFTATTDPGLYYLKNPMNKKGTIIVVPGFHKECYTRGFHKGKRALRQINPMRYVRDNNKDGVLNFELYFSPVGVITEVAATNMHRANSNPETPSKIVDKWSAGCQVLSKSSDMDKILKLCDISVDTFKRQDLFSYSLFLESDL